MKLIKRTPRCLKLKHRGIIGEASRLQSMDAWTDCPTAPPIN